MITGKQKRYLKKLAHHVQPIMQIGKNSITENFISTFDDALYNHELIKVSVLQNCLEEKDDLAKQLCETTGCELVQIIGHQIVFYKKSDKEDLKDRIVLP